MNLFVWCIIYFVAHTVSSFWRQQFSKAKLFCSCHIVLQRRQLAKYQLTTSNTLMHFQLSYELDSKELFLMKYSQIMIRDEKILQQLLSVSAIIAGCSAAGIVAVIATGMCWFRWVSPKHFQLRALLRLQNLFPEIDSFTAKRTKIEIMSAEVFSSNNISNLSCGSPFTRKDNTLELIKMWFHIGF